MIPRTQLPEHKGSRLQAMLFLLCIFLPSPNVFAGPPTTFPPQPLPSALPATITGVGIEQRLDAQLPLAESFRDETGALLPLNHFFAARPVILVPAYYGCQVLCSEVLGGLFGSLKGMSLQPGRDFQVVVLSFDPADTPAHATEQKQHLLRRAQPTTASAWHFLTGAAPAISRVMQAIGYRYSYDPRSKQYAHAAGFVVLTPAGRVSRYFLGIDFSPRELRLGLVQASAGTIGTVLDRLLVFCYSYDPMLSKWGARVVPALRIAAVLTLLALAGLLIALLYRERGRQHRSAGNSDGEPARI